MHGSESNFFFYCFILNQIQPSYQKIRLDSELYHFNPVAHLYDEVQRRNILPQHVVGEVVPGDPVVGLGEGGQARVEEDELREVVAVQNPRSGRPLTTTW